MSKPDDKADPSARPTPVVPKPELVDPEMLKAFDSMRSVWAAMRANHTELAQTRRTMYLAYVKAGFSEQQALELCRYTNL